MTHQVLARKWRPKNFASLVGQEHVVKALTHALSTKRLHHAYLFTGTRGVGKTTLSRILAKSLNCETGITATPCGQCGACLEIDAGRFVDYMEMDAASNRSVDEMTAVLDKAMYSPTAGRYKVYVIDEVHMLTNHAFNAMLKTLEEPPEHVCFVLATTDPQKVPATVLSRCMQFNLRNLAPTVIAERLTYVLGEEKVPFDQEALLRLGRAANGSMRDALSLLDQAIAFGGGEVGDATVMQMLGLVDSMYVRHILEALAAKDGARLVSLADELQATGGAFEDILLDVARELQQIALVHEGLGEHPQYRHEFAKSFGPQATQVYYQISIHGAKDLPLAPDALTGFTMTLLRLLAFVPGASGEQTGKSPVSLPASPSPRTSVARPSLAPTPSKPAAFAPVASAPNAAPTSAIVSATQDFDGDWPALAKAVRLLGFAQQFLQQSQLVKYETLSPGYVFYLKVPIKILAESANVNKVKEALTQHFGQPVRVVAEVGTVEEGTAAHVTANEKAEAQAQAQTAIDNDSFVQGLQKEFGATIVSGSTVPK